jgi:hypothetical protein
VGGIDLASEVELFGAFKNLFSITGGLSTKTISSSGKLSLITEFGKLTGYSRPTVCL